MFPGALDDMARQSEFDELRRDVEALRGQGVLNAPLQAGLAEEHPPLSPPGVAQPEGFAATLTPDRVRHLPGTSANHLGRPKVSHWTKTCPPLHRRLTGKHCLEKSRAHRSSAGTSLSAPLD